MDISVDSLVEHTVITVERFFGGDDQKVTSLEVWTMEDQYKANLNTPLHILGILPRTFTFIIS